METAGRLGKEMLTVSLDFDDRVMRMGYGDIGAVTLLLDAGISVHSSPGLRTALVVLDNEGYIFTPTALYLEAEPSDGAASNAMRMSGEQKLGGSKDLENRLRTTFELIEKGSKLSSKPLEDQRFLGVGQSRFSKSQLGPGVLRI